MLPGVRLEDAAASAGVLTLATVLPPDLGSWRITAAYALVLGHTLPIAVRWRFPLPALAWGLATGVAFAALQLSLVPLGVLAKLQAPGQLVMLAYETGLVTPGSA